MAWPKTACTAATRSHALCQALSRSAVDRVRRRMLYGERMCEPVLVPACRSAVRPLPGAASVAALLLALLAGCSSVPLPPSGTASIPPPTANPIPRPDRDGAPERPPEDLASVPDAVPRVEPILPKGPNKPYVVLGQGYEPLAEDLPFKQRGVASWYGTKFHGKRTASGEVYSMYGMSAAHRTLPIPSYARIRNLANGKEVIVRVNDRGPFHSQRVLDLSYTAAAKLEILSRGSAEVEIERLTFEDIRTGRWSKEPNQAVLASAGRAVLPIEVRPVPAVAPAAAPVDPIYALASRLDGAVPSAVASGVPDASVSESVSDSVSPAAASASARDARPSPETRARAFTPGQSGYWVQLAAFSQRPGVDAFQQKVALELSHLAPLLAVFQEGPGYRLQVGPYARRDEAQSVAQRVRDTLKLVPMVVERR
jgi:rare lipoprotein A